MMSAVNYAVDKLSAIFVNKSMGYQKGSPLGDPALWDLQENEHGHLCVGGVDTVELVEKYGSPLLVVNKKKLVQDAEEIKHAFFETGVESLIMYSYKTNCIPGILQIIHQLGIGAEVISPYELWLSEKLGVPGNLVVYNGVNKDSESIRRAVRMGVRAINIDHAEEVDRVYNLAKDAGKKVNLGIRLALLSKAQFGLEIINDEAMNICQKIAERSDFLNMSCIHFNVTSNAKQASVHKDGARKALRFIHRLKNELGIHISSLDIGGGFGVPTTKNMTGKEYGLYRLFGSLPKPPHPGEFQPIKQYVKEIVADIQEICGDLNLEVPKIFVEPGRFITSRCEFLLSTVLAIKKKEKGTPFVITDTGRLSMTFPCDFEYHEMFVASKMKSKKEFLYNVMGRICTSADWMFKNRYLPELNRGDILAIMDAGAYFSSYSTNFAFPRPAIVVVSKGKSWCVREGETFDHLIAMDRFKGPGNDKIHKIGKCQP